MEQTDERLQYKLEAIKHKQDALLEEYKEVKQKILDGTYGDKNLSYLVTLLRDNLKNQKALEKEIRQAYKDSLRIK